MDPSIRVYASESSYPAFDVEHARERPSAGVVSDNDPLPSPIADDFVVVDMPNVPSWMERVANAATNVAAGVVVLGTVATVVASSWSAAREAAGSEPELPSRVGGARVTSSSRAHVNRDVEHAGVAPSGGHCTRCGHSGHNVSTCYAKRNAYGRPVGSGRRSKK